MITAQTGRIRSAPGRATNTLRGLTRSLDLGKEGLAMDATRSQGSLRRCRRCEHLRPVEDYYAYVYKGEERLGRTCKQCGREQRQKAHREIRGIRGGRGRLPRKSPGDMTIRERVAYYANYKQSHGCTDCGRDDDWRILHFDHLPEHTKLFDISWAVHRPGEYTDAEIAAEVAKCEVVCADCHAVRTRERMGPEVRPPWWSPTGAQR